MKTTATKPRNLALSIITEKCPHCGEGQVFEKKKHWYNFMPIMKERCDICHYHFDREPGYFLGAMYISYGLAVAQGIATFIILTLLFPTMEAPATLPFIFAVIIGFAQKNFKVSRIIYIRLFPW